jgi:hypothetical protein
MARHAVDMPEVTDTHRRQAYEVMRWWGWSFDAAMADRTLRALIEAKAAWLRTTEWERTTKRTVQRVPRIVMGTDGHPIGYVSQLVQGQRAPTNQLALIAD